MPGLRKYIQYERRRYWDNSRNYRFSRKKWETTLKYTYRKGDLVRAGKIGFRDSLANISVIEGGLASHIGYFKGFLYNRQAEYRALTAVSSSYWCYTKKVEYIKFRDISFCTWRHILFCNQEIIPYL